VDEIDVDLSTFLYHHVAKQITKETTHMILKEDWMNIMQLDKSIFIHNTAADLVAIATVGTIIIQAIE